MDTNLFGTKELYWAAIKATSTVEVDGRIVEPNETIAEFSNIQISAIQEVKEHWVAEGGYENEGRVFWDSTKEINFNFSQGIFSKAQLALLSNSDIYKRKKEIVWLPETETLESDENGNIQLKYFPNTSASIFVYRKDNNEKIKNFTISDNIINIKEPYVDTIIHYYFEHVNDSTIIRIGTRLIKGFVRLEGKTRLKDDKTGHNVTGFIVIPKMKLMSDLSMRLGKDATPMVANFTGVGYPFGDKMRKTVCEIAILDDDIDKVF